jgi:hypothetical protein
MYYKLDVRFVHVFYKKVHSLYVKTSTKNYVQSPFFVFLSHEANIRGGGKPVHVVLG